MAHSKVPPSVATETARARRGSRDCVRSVEKNTPVSTASAGYAG